MHLQDINNLLVLVVILILQLHQLPRSPTRHTHIRHILLLALLVAHQNLHDAIARLAHLVVVNVQVALAHNRIDLDAAQDVAALGRRREQQQRLEVRLDNLVVRLALVVGLEQLQLVQHALGVGVGVLLGPHERQQDVGEQVGADAGRGEAGVFGQVGEEHGVGWDVEGGVFDRRGDAQAADVALVVGEDLDLGHGDDVGVVLLWCGEVLAAFCELAACQLL